MTKVVPVLIKGLKTDVNNYCPISVLLCLSKLPEKLVIKYITSFLDKHEVIHPNHYGFCKKHSISHVFLD